MAQHKDFAMATFIKCKSRDGRDGTEVYINFDRVYSLVPDVGAGNQYLRVLFDNGKSAEILDTIDDLRAVLDFK
jgi:hypothetical protein